MIKYLILYISLLFCSCTNIDIAEIDSKLTKLELDDNFFDEFERKPNTDVDSTKYRTTIINDLYKCG